MSGCGKSDQGEERKRARSEDDDDGDDNGGHQSKRQQTAKTEEAVHFRLSKEMQELTQSGSKYASAASLTKEFLIKRLKGAGKLLDSYIVPGGLHVQWMFGLTGTARYFKDCQTEL